MTLLKTIKIRIYWQQKQDYSYREKMKTKRLNAQISRKFSIKRIIQHSIFFKALKRWSKT